MNCNMPDLPVHHQLPEFTQTRVPRVGNAIQPSHPLSPPSPPALNLSQHQGLFKWVRSSHQVQVLSLSFNISPSNKHPGLISFRTDWLDLLEAQRSLKSLLRHHSSKVSILLCSAFFIVQLSHPYMTTGKTIALARQTFIDTVMSLLFNMLSRLVITFLPRSTRLLISWLQSQGLFFCYRIQEDLGRGKGGGFELHLQNSIFDLWNFKVLGSIHGSQPGCILELPGEAIK